ncbi:DNA primase [Candidatus Binatus sp.]|jgi:DNA primase|uniref:DNA primase n=1 Tax=Candidatus Binatus sp. TaxID=2811406 RepID=UPI003C604A4C
MGRFGDDKIEEVRSRADIVEIVGAHVRLRRAGRNFVGLCPFHNEKTPSFSVNAERGFFHCFGCGAGGSVFNFIMRVEGLTFPEAVRSLARKYGVTLPEHDQSGAGAGEREAMLKASEVAAEFFAHVLWNSTDGALARDYLKSRGISVETARAFMIGFAPSWPASLAKALERRGLRDAGVKVGLVRKDGDGAYDMFRARVMFPIRDAQGRVLAFGGRVLDARLPKYINSPESPLYSKARTLYGLFEARQAISSNASAGKDRAILVEGYFDVIALWQAGFKEAVAGCGTALTVEQLRALSRYTKNVIACFDGDAAGRKASMRALEIFLQAGLLGRGIFIPSGFDPDTFIRERGAAAFAELTDKSELLIDYFLSEQAGEARGSIAERARAAQRVAEMLKLVDDPFQFDLLARKAADLLSIGEEVLRKEARGRQSRPTPSRFSRAGAAAGAENRPATPGGGDAGSKAEIGLVAIALLHPELRAEIAQSGAAANFEEIRLGGVLADLCRTEEAYTALEQWTAERLSAGEQSRISEFAVGPLSDDIGDDTQKNPNELEKCRALVNDYVVALDRRRRAHELGRLRRSAAEVSARESEPGEAAAAAQAVIAHRREGRGQG